MARHDYPHVQQVDANTCGAASLLSVLRRHDTPAVLEEVVVRCGTDTQGANLLGLTQAAQAYGFAASAVRGSFDDLLKNVRAGSLPIPFIIHVKRPHLNGHYVAVHAYAGNRFVVSDPARPNLEEWTGAEFAGQWTGNLLVLVPDPTAPPAPEASAVGQPAPAELGAMLGSFRGVYRDIVLYALLVTLMAVGGSYAIKYLVDAVFVHGESGRGMLNAIAAGLVLLLLFRVVCSVLREYLSLHLGRVISKALDARYVAHLLRLPLAFHHSRTTGDLVSRHMDVQKIREVIALTLPNVAIDVIVATVVLAVLWGNDARVAGVGAGAALCVALAVVAHYRAAVREARREAESEAVLSTDVTENTQQIELIKATAAEGRRTHQTESALVRFHDAVYRVLAVQMSLHGCGTLITGLAVVALLWAGGQRVLAGQLTVGQLMFCYALLLYLIEPLERLAMANVKWQEGRVAWNRLRAVLEVPAEPAGPRLSRFPGLRQCIRFCKVGFAFPGRPQVLDGLDLEIRKGTRVALVGSSGCGKSTILRLLLRLVGGPPHTLSGRILIDGVSVSEYDPTSLRPKIALVPQDAPVLSGTIRSNIAMYRPGAALREVRRAARVAGLKAFIDGLPEGYETHIGERGVNLSGGQKQRLAIARAVLSDADVILLDESTSQLDAGTERKVLRRLFAATRDKTLVIVAHRLATVRRADTIFVLDRGRVVESGGHEHLLAAGGRYARLWSAQTGAGHAPDADLPFAEPVPDVAEPVRWAEEYAPEPPFDVPNLDFTPTEPAPRGDHK